jgi:hypothetical protein
MGVNSESLDEKKRKYDGGYEFLKAGGFQEGYVHGRPRILSGALSGWYYFP